MNIVERARLRKGMKIRYNDRDFVYHVYAYKAHCLREERREVPVIYLTGFKETVPFYEYLSNKEILVAEMLER